MSILSSSSEDSGKIFRVAVEHFKSDPRTEIGISEREAAYDKWSKRFRHENLELLDDKDFLAFLNIEENKSWTGLQRHPEVASNMTRLREAISFILDNAIDVEERVRETVGRQGAYHIEGMGKNLVTGILRICDTEEKHGVWNNRSEKILKELDFVSQKLDVDPGKAYKTINKALNDIKDAYGLTLNEVDLLMWWIDELFGKAILWSVNVQKSPRVIENHQEVIKKKGATLWGVDFPQGLKLDQWGFPAELPIPANGYLYVKGERVKYRAMIEEVECYPERRLSRDVELRPPEYAHEGHRIYLKLTGLDLLPQPMDLLQFRKTRDNKPVSSPQAVQAFVYVFDPFLTESTPRGTYLLLRSQPSTEWKDDLRTGGVYHLDSRVPNHTKVKADAHFVIDQITEGRTHFIGYGMIDFVEERATEETTTNGRRIIEKFAKIGEYHRFEPPKLRAPKIAEALRKLPNYNTQHSVRVVSKEVFEKITAQRFSFELTAKDFEACRRSKKTNYIGPVRQKFENTLKPELIEALGENFEDFVTKGRHPSPYVASVWTRRDGGRYRGHMWLGMAHKKYKDPRRGIQFQFGINRRSVFSFGIWIEGRGHAQTARTAAKERIENRKGVILSLLRKLGDDYRIYAANEKELDEKANELNKEGLDVWTPLIGDNDYYFQIYRDLSKEDAIGKGTSLVEHIAATFQELRPLYNLLAGLEEPLNEREQIALAHLLSGRNLIFYGPPGTGKTRSATEIAERLCGEENYMLVTANAEWTAYDVIGGPIQSKEGFGFKPGFFTLAVQNCVESLKKRRPHWLIIDEINRANLDLSFGKIFTLFDLDYRQRHSVIDESMLEKLAEEDKQKYGPLNIPPEFRILATMNTYDRAILFSLGYAFRRRFAFVEVPSPYSIEKEEEYTINEAEWRVEEDEEFITMKKEFEDEMDRIWKEGLYFRLSQEGTGMKQLEDIVSRIRELDTKVRQKQLDPFNPYSFAHDLSRFVAERKIVEVGYGQIMDIIRFALTHTAIFSEEDPRKGMIRALDEATKAYFLPLIGYYLPRARRMMTIGKQEEDPLEKLKDLESFLATRGLRRSSRKTRELRADLERGEITLF